MSRRTLDLAGRTLADLDGLIPRLPSGQRARHLVSASLRLTEPAHLTPTPGTFPVATASGPTLRLTFASLGDLERLGLSGRMVAQGHAELRLFLPPGLSERYAALPPRARHLSTSFPPSDAPRLLVALGDSVAQGDTLAFLRAADLDRAASAVEAARLALSAAAEPPSYAAAEAVAFASAAREEHARSRTLRERGYLSGAAIEALSERLRRAEHRAAEAQRAYASALQSYSTRRRQAELALSEALRTHAHLRRSSALTSPISGRITRAETTPTTPDRHTLHLTVSQ